MTQTPSKLECSAEFINSTVSESSLEDFFTDSGRRVFTVTVYHLTEDDVEPPLRGIGTPIPQPPITNLNELTAVLQDKLPLWLTPYVIITLRKEPDLSYAFIKDRGLRFRAWLLRKRLDQVFDEVYKRYRNHLEIKRLKRNIGKTRHIVMTITLDPKQYDIAQAYRFIPKRLRQIREYVRRRYGLNAYLAVLEVHESGYPHLHALFITKKPLKVFKHERIWRFEHKRLWEKDLNATAGNFIDCFALHSHAGVRDYFRKYAGKFLDPDILNGKKLNIKSLALPIARLFRIRVLYTNVRTPRPQRYTSQFLDDVIRIGKLIEEYHKARDLRLKSTLYHEIRQRIVELLSKHKLAGNDLIDHISPFGPVMADPDQRLNEIQAKRLEEKVKMYWEICYRHYVYAYRVIIVLGYRYSLGVISVASE